jgi:hypothetical protein
VASFWAAASFGAGFMATADAVGVVC